MNYLMVAIKKHNTNEVLTFNLSDQGDARVKELYTKLGETTLIPDSSIILDANGVHVAELLTPLEDLKDWLFEVDPQEQEWCDD